MTFMFAVRFIKEGQHRCFGRFLPTSVIHYSTNKKINLKKASSRQWLLRQLNDKYVKLAKIEHWRCRSAFKLIEINDKYKIFQPGMKVLDCGAAPGSWSQVAARYVADKSNGDGMVISVDRDYFKPVEGCICLRNADFTNDRTKLAITKLLHGNEIDVILSDMAPNASGHKEMDHEQIISMVTDVLQFAYIVLKNGGTLVCKIWEGEKTRHFESYHCMDQQFNPKNMFTRIMWSRCLAGTPRQMFAEPRYKKVVDICSSEAMSTFDTPASETIEKNAFYDKYKDKLEKLRQTNMEAYKDAVDAVYKKKEQYSQSENRKHQDVKGSAVTQSMMQSSRKLSDNKTKKNNERMDLNSILKVDLLKDKSAEEITKIWTAYHSKKEGIIFSVIPATKYNRIHLKGKQCSTFIYPVPREQGYEFFLGECADNDWYYTPLLAYQTHNEFAPYSLAIRYYTEFMSEKEIVLMKGEIAANDLPTELATILVHQTQIFYGSDENFKLVETMNSKPDDFKYMDVVEVCQKAGLF